MYIVRKLVISDQSTVFINCIHLLMKQTINAATSICQHFFSQCEHGEMHFLLRYTRPIATCSLH